MQHCINSIKNLTTIKYTKVQKRHMGKKSNTPVKHSEDKSNK